MLYWIIVCWVVLAFLIWLFVAGAKERARQDKIFTEEMRKRNQL